MEIERLRGLAVLMVMLGHISFLHHFIPSWARQTYTGVDLFFVISGLVVFWSMKNRWPTFERQSFSKRLAKALPTLGAFYLRRLFRILPAAFFWALVPLAFILFFGDPLNRPFTRFDLLKEFFYVLTFQYNYALIFKAIPGFLGPYWSLSVEEHFYLLFPWAFVIWPEFLGRVKIFAATIFTIAFIVRPLSLTLGQTQSFEWLRFATHHRLDSLAMGVLLGLLITSEGLKELLENYFQKSNKKLWQIFGLFLVVLLWFGPALQQGLSMQHLGLFFLLFICAFLVFLASMDKNLILNLGPFSTLLEFLGKRSYGLYLIHNFVELIIHRFLPHFSPGMSALLWAGLTLVLSELSFRLLENPFIHWGKRFSNSF